MKPIVLLPITFFSLVAATSFAEDSAPAAYREPAEFTITSTVVNPNPGGFTATFNGPRNETLVSAEYEPFNYRTRVYSEGDGENTIPLNRITASAYDTLREGFFNGATVRIYRIINGELHNVRTDKVARHRSSGWMETAGDKLISPDQPEFQWSFDAFNSPINPYYFTVVAVSADGTRSAPSAVLKVMRPEKVGPKANNTNLFAIKRNGNSAAKPSATETPGAAPATPGNFKVDTGSDGILKFSWNAVPDAAGYIVLRSDYPPESHTGYGFDLAGKAKTSEEHIKTGDLVFVDMVRTDYSRDQLASNRVWDVSTYSGAPTTFPTQNDDGGNTTWSLVPHPGPIPPEFKDTERGRTCLQVDMKGGKEINLFKYSYANSAQEYYQVLQPGRTYTLEFWAKEDGMKDPTIRFRATAIYDKSILKDFTINGAWHKYTYDFIPDKEFPRENKIVGSMCLRFNGPGKLWLDGWRVYPKDAGYFGTSQNDIDALKTSGMAFLRTHGFIKSSWSYYLDDLLSSNGLSGSKGAKDPGIQPTLPSVLDFMEKTGVCPWLQIEMSFSENEWMGLVEYLAAPYDPAKDTPQSKPWAYRRYSLGHPKPWIDVFPRFVFELSNEMWNLMIGFAPWHFPFQKMTDAATGKVYENGELAGLATKYALQQMQRSPYWPALGQKLEPAVGGWLLQLGDNGFGQQALRVAPVIKNNLVANYNGGWDEGAGAEQANDAGFRRVLTVVPQYIGIKNREFAATRDRMAKQGVNFRIGTYEAGPGYTLPGTVSKEMVEQQNLMMKSLAAGAATLDCFLDGAAQGMGLQNFFTFSRGRDYWSSHARADKGGQAYPSWLGLELYNQHGQGDFMEVQTKSVPTDFLPPQKKRREVANAPLTAAYATHNGDRITVFVISRKLDHFPYANDDGITPVTLNLPFSKVRKITLYKMDGNPRDNNLDAENVRIESSEIPASAFSPRFILDQTRGAAKGGLPPAAVYAYVFEGVQQ